MSKQKRTSATGNFLSGKREGRGEREGGSERERECVIEREREGGAGQQAGIFKVRLGLRNPER